MSCPDGTPSLGCCEGAPLCTTGIAAYIRPCQYNGSASCTDSTGANATAASNGFRNLYENFRARCLNDIPELTDADYGFHTVAWIDETTINPDGTGGNILQQPWLKYPGWVQYKTSQILAYLPNDTGIVENHLDIAAVDVLTSSPLRVQFLFRKGRAAGGHIGLRAKKVSANTGGVLISSSIRPDTDANPSFCRTNEDAIIEWNTERYKIRSEIIPTGLGLCPLPPGTFGTTHDLICAFYRDTTTSPPNSPCPTG